jgi:hypothetical protein
VPAPGTSKVVKVWAGSAIAVVIRNRVARAIMQMLALIAEVNFIISLLAL